MLIIPAIDMRGGLCVRLNQGDYNQERIYDSDPARVATEFEANGAEWLHVVDLDGAKSGEPQNWDSLQAIRRRVSMQIEFGGGIRSVETARTALDLGIDRVIVGSKLVHDPDMAKRMFDEFGERVVAGIDVRNGNAATIGWTKGSDIDAVRLAADVVATGARRIILTDIGKDGTLGGPNLDLLAKVSTAVKVPVIHSGGIGELEDIAKLIALSPQPEGAIVGRALYENRFTVREAIELVESLVSR